jgi:hypothetical protein
VLSKMKIKKEGKYMHVVIYFWTKNYWKTKPEMV